LYSIGGIFEIVVGRRSKYLWISDEELTGQLDLFAVHLACLLSPMDGRVLANPPAFPSAPGPDRFHPPPPSTSYAKNRAQ
jgi:hypothetical protein